MQAIVSIAELNLVSALAIVTNTGGPYSRCQVRWEVVDVVRLLLLANKEVLLVGFDHSAIIQHDIVADSPLGHLSPDGLSGALWMQLALLDLIEVVLDDFERNCRRIWIVGEIFRQGSLELHLRFNLAEFDLFGRDSRF